MKLLATQFPMSVYERDGYDFRHATFIILKMKHSPS